MFRLRPLSEAIEGIAKAGFNAVELMADRPHAYPEDLKAADITALNQRLSDWKMKVSNLNSCVVTALGDAHHPSWIEEDWQEREKRIRYTLDCLRLAAALGIFYITIGPGGPTPETMNQREALRLFVANMHRVLPLAEKLGVKVLVQAEPGWLIETSDQLLNFLRELDFHEYLGVNFDPCHFFCMEEDPIEAWEKLKSYVGHVHLEDTLGDHTHRPVQLGEGAMDISSFLRHLQKLNYEGFVTIKLGTHEQRAKEMAFASAQYLKEHGFIAKKEDDS
jgi:sugar phosphate isomerase/epimerase